MPWRDLIVLVRRWVNEPGTSLSAAVHGYRLWSVSDQLLAMAVDALHMANWQRAGRRTAPRPKPVPRPWEQSKAQVLGKDPIPVSQFDDWWESQSRR